MSNSLKITILIIEDEQNIASFICKTLKMHQYKTLQAFTGAEGLSMASSQCPDLILLDLGLPDMDGLKIIEDIRKWSSIPIIVVSARTQEKEKVAALDAGADDYITKPFGVMELISRVKAMLRRSKVSDGDVAKEITVGRITLNRETHRVSVDGVGVELTYKEFELLKLLMMNARIVTTREVILDRVWGTDYEGESRTLDMHIKTLRQKLKDASGMIKTVRNVGYILNEEEN